MIKPEDELLHEWDKDDDWQESWYFNWTDAEHNTFGLCRIGFRPNQHGIDGLILTIRDGKPEFAYPAVNISHPSDDWSDQDPRKEMRSKGFTVKMIEPLKKWHLGLSGKNKMDLTFEAFTPVFDFVAEGGALAATMSAEHIEQSGRVTGTTEFKGNKIEINGTGQRDKSWGVRRWHTTLGWNWISCQFSDEYAFNVTQTFDRDPENNNEKKQFDNGFVFRDGENFALDSLDLDLTWGSTAHVFKTAEITLVDSGGEKHLVHAEALGHFPLVRRGAWLQESHTKFTTTIDGKELVGYGMIEHVWRPSVVETILRVPGLIGAAATVLRP